MQVISIIKRENALGLVSYQEKEDRYVRTRSDVRARIKTALAAGAAENVWFGETTTGVTADLRQATWAAATMAGLFGMGKELRSEEHTSELQSRQYLVCRLLLEK